jgi:hypothetical protein
VSFVFVDSPLKIFLLNWLEEIIDAVKFECLYGILVIRGNKDDRDLNVDFIEDLKTLSVRQLDIQQK